MTEKLNEELQTIETELAKFDDSGDRPQSPPAHLMLRKLEIQKQLAGLAMNEPTYDDVMKIVKTLDGLYARAADEPGDDRMRFRQIAIQNWSKISAFLTRLGEQPASDEQAKKDAEELARVIKTIDWQIASGGDVVTLMGATAESILGFLKQLSARLAQPTTKPVAFTTGRRSNGFWFITQPDGMLYGVEFGSKADADYASMLLNKGMQLVGSPPLPVTEEIVQAVATKLCQRFFFTTNIHEQQWLGTVAIADAIRPILAPSPTPQPERKT